MVYNECNLRAGVYKVQTFGTTQAGTAFQFMCPNLEYKMVKNII